ncbi:uncharacterized protein LOC116214768 [Punica granatum]|uniref:SPRY domain-containing protein n=2 Tax=Punica granatum TaxID=22663 RepID=A0A218WFK9_PUNGR|nr:uncharacterized protein LOC116214768 [Punica granatum]OWM70852.1 hypothetical protein CDL15_Pgr014525 [Punica granatum]PKI69708.1 hypothetical protein CRG98_009864 [Punica granatum]
MPEWMQLALAVFFILGLAAGLVLFIWRCWCWKYRPKPDQFVTRDTARVGADHRWSLRAGIAKLHQTSTLHQDSRRRLGNYAFRGSYGGGRRPGPPFFSWADHPSLVTDAVENGWSGFAFATHALAQQPSRASLLGLCGAGDVGRDPEPDISWEVCQGSADFVQKIRLNPSFRRINSASTAGNNHNHLPFSALSVIKTSLPLPGPPLGNSSFPQEAYFEITIVGFAGHHESIGRVKEGERTKLIQESFNLRSNSESLVHISKAEEFKLTVRDDGKNETVAASIGLTAGGALPLKLPGSYPGSIGFNSTGSVYLDGIKLAFESKKAEWGMGPNKVIGCGFNPRQKKVFFTVGSDLMHVIHCKPEEFGAPLYPTLAANSDITVLVNLGQCPFEYSPANAHRTSNPCFIGPVVNSSAAALGYDDSRELFSMGRIDSQWLNGFINRGSYNHNNNNNNNNNRGVEFEEESEADLFEIVLDSSSGRSPVS